MERLSVLSVPLFTHTHTHAHTHTFPSPGVVLVVVVAVQGTGGLCVQRRLGLQHAKEESAARALPSSLLLVSPFPSLSFSFISSLSHSRCVCVCE